MCCYAIFKKTVFGCNNSDINKLLKVAIVTSLAALVITPEPHETRTFASSILLLFARRLTWTNNAAAMKVTHTWKWPSPAQVPDHLICRRVTGSDGSDAWSCCPESGRVGMRSPPSWEAAGERRDRKQAIRTGAGLFAEMTQHVICSARSFI